MCGIQEGRNAQRRHEEDPLHGPYVFAHASPQTTSPQGHTVRTPQLYPRIPPAQHDGVQRYTYTHDDVHGDARHHGAHADVKHASPMLAHAWPTSGTDGARPPHLKGAELQDEVRRVLGQTARLLHMGTDGLV